MLHAVKGLVALDNPLRLLYHKIRAVIANVVYGFPHKDMLIIGVTGTNGKTTTSNIIAKGLKNAGKKVFLFSTVNIIIGDEEYTNETKMTSPDVFELQRLLALAKKKGCEIAVIETASHGIKMHRIWGLNYDIVALTNISQDHLDLHKTMSDYVQTKLEIFKRLMYYQRKPGVKKTAIVNLDAEYADLFMAETSDTLITYGRNTQANLQAREITLGENGMKFTLRIPGESLHIETALLGDFNVYNIMCAVAVFISLGLSTKQIKESIKLVSGVPGRMEFIPNDLGFKVYVDYAHTEDALEQVLTTLGGLENRQRLITVFGATGDRDKTKRPIMGGVVSKKSDVVILTQDDDYSEKTTDIIKDVLPGIERKEGEDFWIIQDRKEAIRTALLGAQKGDIVLIAGKGDEHTMVTNMGRVEWHDRTIVQEILQDIKNNTLVKG